MKKICTKCGVEKDVAEFNKDRRIKDGLHCKCRLWQSVLRKEYYKKHKEEEDIAHKEYRKNNKEKLSQYNVDYYKNNIEYELNRSRVYRENHRDKTRLAARLYYYKNKEKVKAKRYPAKKKKLKVSS